MQGGWLLWFRNWCAVWYYIWFPGGLLRPLLYNSSVFSCHLLIFFLPLFGCYGFCPMLCLSLHGMFPWYLQFSWRDLHFFLFYCFSSISLHCSLKKAFLSLLAILWNSAFSGYIFLFTPCFSLLFFPQLFVKTP